MNTLLFAIIITGTIRMELTPFRVESLLIYSPENRVSEYDYRLQENSFRESVVKWLFTPEINYSKTRVDNQDAVYDEDLSLYLSIFSPMRISSLSENYFALKQSAISTRISKNNVFITTIEYIFDYEYTRQKFVYDSLNMEYARKMLALSRERLSLGLSDSLDLLRALDNLASVKLVFLEDSMSLVVLEKKIKDILGIQGDFVVVLDSFIPPAIDSLSPLGSESIRLNKELKKSALTGTYLSLLLLLPEVGVKYSWDYTGNSFERNLKNFDDYKTFRVYLSINPLDFAFNFRRASLRYKKSAWNLKNSIIKERQRFREYMKNLKFLENQIEVLRNRVLLRERSFTLALEKYSQGELSFQDVLKEQADYMGIVTEYLKSRMNIIKLRYNLWYNFGGQR